MRFGGIREFEVGTNTYGVYILPCSDSIEVKHPDGMKYAVVKDSKAVSHHKSFGAAETALDLLLWSEKSHSLVKIDLGKHKLINGNIFNSTTKQKISSVAVMR